VKRVASGFNERIKRLIGAAGSQRKLAELFGVSAPTITGWAAGSEPFDSTFQRIAERTGLSYEWLVDGKGDEKAEVAKITARAGMNRQPMPGARGVLRMAREKAGMSFAELSKRINRPVDYLRALEEGQAPISEQSAELIAAALPTISKHDLMEGSDSPRLVGESQMATQGTKPTIMLPDGMKGRYVPLLSYAQAGTWDADHTDGLYDYTSIFALNVDDRRAFAIKVTGNSMEPALSEGDMIVCSPSKSPTNGDAAVVRTRSEQVFIKYWMKRGEQVTLESANPDYEPIKLPIGEIAGVWPIIQTISARAVRKQL